MQHVRQNVSVVTGRYSLEKIATDHLAAAAKPLPFDKVARPRARFRQLQDRAMQAIARTQDCRQQLSSAAADIRNRLETGKIVSTGNSRRDSAVHTNHRLVELVTILGMSAQIVEQP